MLRTFILYFPSADQACTRHSHNVLYAVFIHCLSPPHDVHSKEGLLAAGYATSDKGGDNIILLTNVAGGRAPLFVPAGHLYEGKGREGADD